MLSRDRFPRIPEKSWKAYVEPSDAPLGLPTDELDRLLCATIVDPHEAQDAREAMGLNLPHRLEDFRDLGVTAQELSLSVVAAWLGGIKEEGIDTFAGEQLRRFSPWVSAWCVCGAAFHSLPTLVGLNKRRANNALRKIAEAIEGMQADGLDRSSLSEQSEEAWMTLRYRGLLGEAAKAAFDYSSHERSQPLPELAIQWPGSGRALSSLLYDTVSSLPRSLTPKDSRLAFSRLGAMLAQSILETRQERAGNRSPRATAREEEAEFVALWQEQTEACYKLAAKACLTYPR